MENKMDTQELYDLKSNIAPHICRFIKEIEDFKNRVFTILSEQYEMRLPPQKEYMKVRSHEIKTGTGAEEKIEQGYVFWILIDEYTYALQFIINSEGKINIVLNEDARNKSNEGPAWYWSRFYKTEDDEQHEKFINKIYSWLTAPEVYDVLQYIVEYVDVKSIRS